MKFTEDQIVSAIKKWARNNMCASCYCDIDTFLDEMDVLINGDDNIYIEDAVEELKYLGADVDEETTTLIDRLIRQEAKVWLADYRKNRKEYESYD